MKLEELIRSRLMAAALELADYNGGPAVFYQSVASDTDPGWNGGRQFPRIDFILNMQANPERQASGQLELNIWCDTTSAPEDLEPGVRAALCGVFLTPADSVPYAMAWARSDAFESRSAANPETLVTGITVLFDVFAFPRQETTDPDPILAVNTFMKSWAPYAAIIGDTPLPEQFTPDQDTPAFYFRLGDLQSERETNTVAWMRGTIAGHVFAPDAQGRLYWLKSLIDELALRGEIRMLDSSPMFLTRLAADNTQDSLTSGQLRIGIRFGILCRRPYAHPLAEIKMER